MNMLEIMQLFTEVLAAAPSALSTVEEAIAAFHTQAGGSTAKVQAVSNAASALAGAATSLVLSVTPQAAESAASTQPTPTPSAPAA